MHSSWGRRVSRFDAGRIERGGSRMVPTGCLGMGVGISSPRKISSWLLSWLGKGKRRTVCYQSEGREESVGPIGCTICGLEDINSLDSVRGSSDSDVGSQRRKISFSTGLGCCLLYLTASGNSELEKMMKLRNEMEWYLDMAKEEISVETTLSKPPQQMTSYACSAMDDPLPEASESSRGLCRTISISKSLSEISTMVMHDQSSQYGTRMQEHDVGELEAELDDELKLLQLSLDHECTHPIYQQDQRGEKASVECAASITNKNLNVGITEPYALGFSNHNCGVSPLELERKLHELLETRQQEEINELEAALQFANRKILEKEAEIAWWKDTAYLFLQRMPQSSQQFSEAPPC